MSETRRVRASDLHLEWCDPSCSFATDVMKHDATIRKDQAQRDAELVRKFREEWYVPLHPDTAFEAEELAVLAEQIEALGESE